MSKTSGSLRNRPGRGTMTNVSGGPRLVEQMINDVAQRARRLRASFRALLWTLLPCAIILLSAPLIIPYLAPPLSTILNYWMMRPALPILPVTTWLFVEMARANGLSSKLNAIFAAEHSDARPCVSYSAIGPLLDMLMSGGLNFNFIQVPTVFLGDLLKSVRVEDEVVLTANQRNYLHELMIQGHWHHDWLKVYGGPRMEETVRCKLRPLVIGSLPVLGDLSSIPVLERFARKTNDPDLRQLALQSVEQIRERMKYGPDQMLRASRAPERPDTLLRAVSGDKPQNRNGHQLLRADKPETFSRTALSFGSQTLRKECCRRGAHGRRRRRKRRHSGHQGSRRDNYRSE